MMFSPFYFLLIIKKKVNSLITEGITKSYGNLIYVKNQLPSFFRLMLIELTLCLDREDEEKEGKVARIFWKIGTFRSSFPFLSYHLPHPKHTIIRYIGLETSPILVISLKITLFQY